MAAVRRDRPAASRVRGGWGALGNAFVVACPHWLDHGNLGARAGDRLWPNGLAARADLPEAMARNAGTRDAFDPARPMLVMFHPEDEDTARYLQERFPGGVCGVVAYRRPDGSGDGIGEVRVFTAPPGTNSETP